jgi:hypothetical protein
VNMHTLIAFCQRMHTPRLKESFASAFWGDPAGVERPGVSVQGIPACGPFHVLMGLLNRWRVGEGWRAPSPRQGLASVGRSMRMVSTWGRSTPSLNMSTEQITSSSPCSSRSREWARGALPGREWSASARSHGALLFQGAVPRPRCEWWALRIPEVPRTMRRSR